LCVETLWSNVSVTDSRWGEIRMRLCVWPTRGRNLYLHTSLAFLQSR
jgi:hypothetical protein